MSATRESVMQKLLDSMEQLLAYPTPTTNDAAQLEALGRVFGMLHLASSERSRPAGLDSGLALTESKLTAARVKYLAHARRKSKAKP